MEKIFLDKVEDNVAVRTWSEMTQRGKSDSLGEGYVSKLWDFTRISVTQNSFFIFGKVDLVPTVEEYVALLWCSKIQWVTARIKQKGDSKCIPWKNLKDIILAHPDTKKKVDVFALSIYGLVFFPKALGHVDEAVSDLFDRLDRRVTPVPTILAETFSHFWKVDKVSYQVFSKNYSPLKELAATPRRDNILEEKWMAILQNLQEEDIEWRAPWLLPDEILYRCRDFDWLLLLGIWGAVGYAPLLVLRQYRSRQFVPATQGLAECEFLYKGDGYKKKVREMTNAWNETSRMKSLAMGPMATHEYNKWWVKRINDNVPRPSSKNSQAIEEHLRVVPSELEIIKQDFERRNAELKKKIKQIEEEKMNLRLDVDVQKLEVKKLRKGKNKAEEDLDNLKTDYKKLRLSIRTDRLGKNSEQ
ncbi:hypothetical protein Goklo_024497 [Gossypium klotzschianum]|uniref:DUF7745 domain-containing protein n=1 Tax=Gossypium klotzschianum TaxID=34286 RepID=A0A7J8W9B1_9ROSI|nr:hypothetical protein [Gossypium klotzschianum]